MSGQLLLEITIRDVEGNLASDTKTRVAFERRENGQTWNLPNPLDFSRGPVRIRLESVSSGFYRCTFWSTLYHPEETEFEVAGDSDLVRVEVTLRRKADAWQAQFVPWAGLAPQFDSLRS